MHPGEHPKKMKIDQFCTEIFDGWEILRPVHHKKLAEKRTSSERWTRLVCWVTEKGRGFVVWSILGNTSSNTTVPFPGRYDSLPDKSPQKSWVFQFISHYFFLMKMVGKNNFQGASRGSFYTNESVGAYPNANPRGIISRIFKYPPWIFSLWKWMPGISKNRFIFRFKGQFSGAMYLLVSGRVIKNS